MLDPDLTVADVIGFMKVLVKVPTKAEKDQGAAAPAAVLYMEDSLLGNISKLKVAIEGQKKFKTISTELDSFPEHTCTLPEGNVRDRQHFVHCCTTLLIYINVLLATKGKLSCCEAIERTNVTKTENDDSSDVGENSQSASDTVDVVGDTFSVSQQQLVKKIIQFVVSLGICPYFMEGVGLPLASRSEYGGLVQAGYSDLDEDTRNLTLFTNIKRLQPPCMKHSPLAVLIVCNNICDVLAGLCQLAYCPSSHHRLKEEQKRQETPNKSTTNDSIGADTRADDPQGEDTGKKTCLTLKDILGCRKSLDVILEHVYQPLVIKQLLLLQGGQPVVHKQNCSRSSRTPKWLRMLCSLFLSQCLGRPSGVLCLLRALTDDERGLENWKKCQTIGKLIAKKPKNIQTMEDYYRLITPQLLEVLRVKDKSIKAQYILVVRCTLHAMAVENYGLTYTQVFCEGILAALTSLTKVTGWGNCKPGDVLLPEDVLSQCIEDLHNVIVVHNHHASTLYPCITFSLHTLFTLLCSMYGGVSYLKPLCKDILLQYLKEVPHKKAIDCLWMLITKRPDSRFWVNNWRWLPKNVKFKPGETGGMICVLGDESDLEDILEEDDIAVTCLVDLLQQIHPEKIVGSFFIDILNQLTATMSSRDTQVKTEIPGMDWTVDKLHSVKMLYLVAAICDTIGPACLSDTAQTLSFIQVMLERCIKMSKKGDFLSLDQIDRESLRMTLGLLTLVISGGMELTDTDKDNMQPLVPLLKHINVSHYEDEMKQLAFNLMVAVATRGHVTENDPSGQPGPKGSCDEQTSPQSKQKEAKTPYQRAIQEMEDPLIPVRGHGLMFLSRLIDARDEEALQACEKLLPTLQTHLADEDSYVYLAAIRAIDALSTQCKDPKVVMATLLDQYGASGEENKAMTTEVRVRVGEALAKATRGIGESIKVHHVQLLNVFLHTTKDADPLMRASSLSNLGELCKNLGWTVGSIIFEIINCCSSILKLDKEEKVRRAAAMLITLMLQGLGEKTMKVLENSLSELYQLMLHVRSTDRDDLVRLHMQMGLDELDQSVKKTLFQNQPLEKKLYVARPPGWDQ